MRLRASVRQHIHIDVLTKRCKPAEHNLAVQAERDSRPYIPAMSGHLRSSGKVTGNVIAWEVPYAANMYFGNVKVDPKTKAAGFLTKDGWRSRRGIKKIRRERKYKYRVGGEQWFTRAKEANLEKWLIIAGKELTK